MDKIKKLENLPFILILALTFLLPIFVLPFLGLSVDVDKRVLLGLGIVISLVAFLINRIQTGRIYIPRNFIFIGASVVLVALFLSSVFSGASGHSLVGLGIEADTFAIVATLMVLMFLASIVFQDKKKISYLYITILVSFFLVFLFQVVNLLFLSFDNAFNLVGGWNDLGIFFGFVAVLSLGLLEMFPLSRALRTSFMIALILSMVGLLLVNFITVWVVVGIFAFILFAYAISFDTADGGRKIIRASFFVILISLLPIFATNLVAKTVLPRLNVSYLEVRPTLGSTLTVAKELLKTKPILGLGPNKFNNGWQSFKPEGVNLEPFWNFNFGSGFSFLVTSLITTGILGFLAWVFFLATFFYHGVRAVFTSAIDRVSRSFLFISFMAAVYLWIFVIIYTPGPVNMALAFIMTGAFMASLVDAGFSRNIQLSFFNNPRAEFASVLILIFFVIGSLGSGYFFLEKFASLFFFQKYAVAAGSGDINKAEEQLVHAIRLSNEDLYFRSMADLYSVRINQLLTSSNLSKETLEAHFFETFRVATQNAQSAVDSNPTNFINWMERGAVYGNIVPTGLPGAYEQAVASYNKATELSPTNPTIPLILARLEVLKGDNKKARGYIDQALSLKSNFTDAIFLLSQIEASEGNLDKAISSAKQAVTVNPSDVGALFQWGFLRYRARDFKGAVEVLGQAVSLSPNYSNAKYFLGLSYYYLGQVDKAIQQFEGVVSLNPDNQEVKNILTNLKGGRDPLGGITPPPDKRDKPPVKER